MVLGGVRNEERNAGGERIGGRMRERKEEEGGGSLCAIGVKQGRMSNVRNDMDKGISRKNSSSNRSPKFYVTTVR